jgi:hypothetical protein
MYRYKQLSYKVVAAEVTAQRSCSDVSSLLPEYDLYPLHMSQEKVEYVKVQKHSENRTLMVTIPFVFAQAIPVQKGDTVKMQLLEGKQLTIEKV